jgi:hypothetical protein
MAKHLKKEYAPSTKPSNEFPPFPFGWAETAPLISWGSRTGGRAVAPAPTNRIWHVERLG